MSEIKTERKIGLIPGTGKQSKGIALRLGKAGFDVMLGSRTEEKAKEAAIELNEKLQKKKFASATNSEIAEKCNLIFIVVPYVNLADTLESIKSKLHKGSIIVDVVVPLTFKDGLAYCIDDLPYPSASEFIQSQVPKGVNVVGAFKTISAITLNKIEKPLNYDIFLSGDDENIKEEIKGIFEKIDGARVINAGPLAASETTEHMTALLLNINKLNKVKHASFKVISGDH
ncbi:MAG: NADPH-dependent F420 reductase [Asgard group archaeon]|nr:NADPH-dependent F420 reductase [Asgard group archaeon]